MGSLSEAGSTCYKMLKLIKTKGNRVRMSHSKSDDSLHFTAFKGEDTLVAHSVEGLFGIINMWETFGEDWPSVDMAGTDFEEYEEIDQNDFGVTYTLTDADGNISTYY